MTSDWIVFMHSGAFISKEVHNYVKGANSKIRFLDLVVLLIMMLFKGMLWL